MKTMNITVKWDVTADYCGNEYVQFWMWVDNTLVRSSLS